MSNPNLEKNLKDRIAIVTGSGRGLGAEIALHLARAGSNIVINDIDPGSANVMASEIQKLGCQTHVNTADIADYQLAQQFVAEVKAKFGRVDILINNAGITRDALFLKMTEEQWDQVVRVNLKGTFNMGQACAKVMAEQKSGKIVNLASVAYLGNVGQSNYTATKAGVVGMTATWAIELARYNINVNAIAPGFIDSAMTQKVPPEVKAKFIEKIPFRRLGQPSDIAQLAKFLVSEESAYMTGQCIVIDGGLSVGL